jgi:acetyl-CoA carboxylase biotin carboxyl carrier protein
MALGFDDVADIVRMIDGSSCDEFILETNEFKLVLRRRGAPVVGDQSHTAQASLTRAAPPLIAAPKGTATGKTASSLGEVPGAKGAEVRSPMVGTFYRAPSPGAPNFVEVGSLVKKGDPLCIIEVMKLFTTIQAEFSGRVAQVGAENNELVEYGRLLFVIEEAA